MAQESIDLQREKFIAYTGICFKNIIDARKPFKYFISSKMKANENHTKNESNILKIITCCYTFSFQTFKFIGRLIFYRLC